jgi:hypothetical protein
MRAAMNGPPAMNLTASIGKNPHEIAYVRTKNVIIGCRFTNDIRHPLSFEPRRFFGGAFLPRAR